MKAHPMAMAAAREVKKELQDSNQIYTEQQVWDGIAAKIRADPAKRKAVKKSGFEAQITLATDAILSAPNPTKTGYTTALFNGFDETLHLGKRMFIRKGGATLPHVEKSKLLSNANRRAVDIADDRLNDEFGKLLPYLQVDGTTLEEAVYGYREDNPDTNVAG